MVRTVSLAWLARSIALAVVATSTSAVAVMSAPAPGGDADIVRTVEHDAAAPLRWRLVDPFHPRPFPAVVLDPDRDRLILTGGAAEDDATWEMPLAGPYEWQRFEDVGFPTIRGREKAIYDPVQRRLILYNVETDGKYYSRTLWQNLNLGSALPGWSELPLTSFPYGGGWEHPATAFDDRRGQHIFYGGYYASSQYSYSTTSDVWTLKSTTSALAKLPIGTHRPSLRTGVGLIYDSQRDRIVTWGGSWYDDVDPQVWTLGMNGDTAWSAMSTFGQAPPPLTEHGMVLDAAHDRAIVLGGGAYPRYEPVDSRLVWTLSLGSGEWRRWEAAVAPASLGRRPIVLMDARRSRVIVIVHDSQATLDVWSLELADEPRWQLLSSTRTWYAPQARSVHAMAIDDSSGNFIVGGRTQTVGSVYLLGSPYARDAHMGAPSYMTPALPGGWSLPQVPAFSAVERSEAVFDSRDHRFIHYGGTGYSDPWGYCHHNCSYFYWYEDNVCASRFGGASAFTKLNRAGDRPPSRAAHAMAYDAARHRIVVFGGFHHDAGIRTDLWSFDLTRGTWEPLAVDGESPASWWYGFYDAATDRFLIISRLDPLLMYALELGKTPLRWSRVPIEGPSPRLVLDEYDVCLDDYRRRLLLVAKAGVFALSIDGGGGPWLPLPVQNQFPSKVGHQVVYDSERDRLVLNGGMLSRQGASPILSELPRSDTWILDFGDSVRHVAVDLRPGSDEDIVNLRSRGLLPAAILGRGDYDAASIDPATVRIGGAPVHRKPNGEWSADARDVNGDGIVDLFLQVETESLQVGAGETFFAVTGRGSSGWRLRGNAGFRMVGAIDRDGADATRLATEPVTRLEVTALREAGRITLSVSLPTAEAARLEVFDVMGRRVVERELTVGEGRHEVEIGTQIGTGLYFARVQQGTRTATARVVALR